ncbi:Putative protein [Zobellia galactanivorans]|uniref:Uncharacterized protein n=1 Tax=Zobellia galactanivorans (strain DSM 12802 / CCUG 47099 / CIP 106680 / NCIMB 13871 / Dsij) TaxID=63186 RepID=G0L2I0_ZOBGA|nr:Putative protein [Zobellia galactanivorans]
MVWPHAQNKAISALLAQKDYKVSKVSKGFKENLGKMARKVMRM